MSKWGKWLKRSTLMLLGAVVISSSAGISALAADASKPEEPVESTESAGNEADAGNTESSESKTDTTLIITNFASLDQDIRLQELEEGEEPNLPDKLDVTVAIKENKEGEATTTAGAGISNVVMTVGEVTQLPKGNTTISGLTWDMVSTSQTNDRITDTYVPVMPAADEYGNNLVLMNTMTQVPVIQTTRSVVQNDQDNTANDTGSA